MILLSFTNACEKPLTLCTVGLSVGKKPLSTKVDSSRGTVKFPHELQPEQHCLVEFNADKIAQELSECGRTGKVKIYGACVDAMCRTHWSWGHRFDVGKHLEGQP